MSANIILRLITDNLSLVENEAASRICEPFAWLLKYLVVCTAVRLQCFPIERRKSSKYERPGAKSGRNDGKRQKPDASGPSGPTGKPVTD